MYILMHTLMGPIKLHDTQYLKVKHYVNVFPKKNTM